MNTKTVAELEAENAKLKETLFGQHGVISGLAIIEECLTVAVKAEHANAPFPLDASQAELWHRAQMEAYRHTLEMISIDKTLLATISAN